MTCGRISAFVTLWLPLSHSKGLQGSPLGNSSSGSAELSSSKSPLCFLHTRQNTAAGKGIESIRECRIWLS